jgi:hypothetical protein
MELGFNISVKSNFFNMKISVNETFMKVKAEELKFETEVADLRDKLKQLQNSIE